MSTKRITRAEVKRKSTLFTILTVISLCIALSENEFVRISFSGITLLLGISSLCGWYIHFLPDTEFELKAQEIEKSKSDPSNSNETTEFNLYHSPDSHFSPHNDD